MIENGKKIKLNYSLTVDGQVIDSNEGRAPFEYQHGKSQILPGLERQLEGLGEGDQREIIVGPEDGYGIVDPKAFVEIPKTRLPEDVIEEGAQLQITQPDGRKFLVTIHEIRDETVLLNFNHPLAGKELHFNIQIVEIK